MTRKALSLLIMAALAMTASAARSTYRQQFDLAVLMDGSPRSEYRHDGTIYIEAVCGNEFAIQLTNPYPYRVAVALSVDGLNTIDAKHAAAWDSAKWVLGPYESTEIAGWQVSGSTARRFFFTGEKQSYGAKIGKTANLGVIEAVVYRERERTYCCPQESRKEEAERGIESAAPPTAGSSAKPAPRARLDDDYAATGMGQREDHSIEMVSIDLDPSPIASFRIRYEFRPQLVKLGVLPREVAPLDRRERAQGFGSWCPDVD
jgi:hypothetical protein